MVFAQLTYRESLRDIEACLGAVPEKLNHLGLRTRAIFVTRAKKKLKWRRRYSHPGDRTTGLICDQTIVLTGTRSSHDYPVPLRRVSYRDPETGQKLNFLTNDFALPALTIAQLYRLRAVATGWGAFAAGGQTLASSNYTVALGAGAEATGATSVALGNGTQALRLTSTAMGMLTTADGSFSTAMGRSSETTGHGAVAMGSYARAGLGSFVFGDRPRGIFRDVSNRPFLHRKGFGWSVLLLQ